MEQVLTGIFHAQPLGAAAARSRRGFTVRGGGMLRTASATSLPLPKIDNPGFEIIVDDRPIRLTGNLKNLWPRIGP